MSQTLESLGQRIDQIIRLAKAGEWDTLSDEADAIVAELDSVSAETPAPSLLAAKGQIQRMLLDLEHAIERCSERKTQISPLLNAFDRIQQSSDKSIGKP